MDEHTAIIEAQREVDAARATFTTINERMKLATIQGMKQRIRDAESHLLDLVTAKVLLDVDD